MKEKQSKSGFTLAELLIVVAIIGVLVAISIPIFTSQLERSREATDAANIRSQYAQVMTEAIATGQNVNGKALYGAISLKQQNSGWNDENMGNNLQSIFGPTVGEPSKGGTAWVEYDAAGQMSILHFDGGTASDGNSGGTTGGDAGGASGGNVTADSTKKYFAGKGTDYPKHNPSKKQYLQPYTLYKYQNDNRTEYYILRGTASKELKAGLPSEETQEDLVHIDVENVKTGESKNSLYGQHASKGQLFYMQDEKKYFVYVDTNSTISKNSKWVEIPSDSK
ncbi:MAG: prepilin-type N-terminal cleavage/methylation domain-containing protein [Firmicutes bacterium]|nr:prepilin-type N-terminal cleavage/methylation domain-containing protein [Bacillota bacterium]